MNLNNSFGVINIIIFDLSLQNYHTTIFILKQNNKPSQKIKHIQKSTLQKTIKNIHQTTYNNPIKYPIVTSQNHSFLLNF